MRFCRGPRRKLGGGVEKQRGYGWGSPRACPSGKALWLVVGRGRFGRGWLGRESALRTAEDLYMTEREVVRARRWAITHGGWWASRHRKIEEEW